MKKLALFLSLNILIINFLIPIQLSAQPIKKEVQEYELPKVDILPDDPLFIFEKLKEKLYLITLKEPDEKTLFLIHLADKRLSMAKQLLKKGKIELMFNTISEDLDLLLEAKTTLSQKTTSHFEKAVEYHSKEIEEIILLSQVKKENSLVQEILKKQELLLKK